MSRISLTDVATASPIIGVLCIDAAQKLIAIYGNDIYSYIAASYVKYLEGAGARVVPIWIGRDLDYYENIMKKINGILIPGGAVFITPDEQTKFQFTSDCVQSSKYIYNIAKRKNSNGEFFPIWGTCLGFQLMMTHDIENDLREDCDRMQCASQIKFEEDFRDSYLFKDLTSELEAKMKTVPFAYHYHRFCITPKTLTKHKLEKDWRILATNEDSNGLRFISLIEHRKFPFFGCQFHPERVQYEHFGKSDDCVHNLSCINCVQYLANSFVEACRHSHNHFETEQKEGQHMIWNFSTYFTGKHCAHWSLCYLFEKSVDYPKEVD